MKNKKITLTEEQLKNLIGNLISEQPLINQNNQTVFDKVKNDSLRRKLEVKNMLKAGLNSWVKTGRVYVPIFNDEIMTKGLNYNDFIDQMKQKYKITDEDIVNASIENTQTRQQTQQQTQTQPQNQWKRNEQFPLKPYDVGSHISRIQRGLGLPPKQQRGYFGSITLNGLKNIGFNIDPNVGIDETMYNQIINKLENVTQTTKNIENRQVPTIPSINPTLTNTTPIDTTLQTKP
jgi:hypothetical protein